MFRNGMAGDTDGNIDGPVIDIPSVEWAYLVSLSRSEIR